MKNMYAPIFLFGLFVVSVYFLADSVKKTSSEKFGVLDFKDIDGWLEDDQSLALTAFQISCKKILKYPAIKSFGEFGDAADWQPSCREAMKTKTEDARIFFESRSRSNRWNKLFDRAVFSTFERAVFFLFLKYC